jgi:hypothetical protein
MDKNKFHGVCVFSHTPGPPGASRQSGSGIKFHGVCVMSHPGAAGTSREPVVGGPLQLEPFEPAPTHLCPT